VKTQPRATAQKPRLLQQLQPQRPDSCFGNVNSELIALR